MPNKKTEALFKRCLQKQIWNYMLISPGLSKWWAVTFFVMSKNPELSGDPGGLCGNPVSLCLVNNVRMLQRGEWSEAERQRERNERVREGRLDEMERNVNLVKDKKSCTQGDVRHLSHWHQFNIHTHLHTHTHTDMHAHTELWKQYPASG